MDHRQAMHNAITGHTTKLKNFGLYFLIASHYQYFIFLKNGFLLGPPRDTWYSRWIHDGIHGIHGILLWEIKMVSSSFRCRGSHSTTKSHLSLVIGEFWTKLYDSATETDILCSLSLICVATHKCCLVFIIFSDRGIFDKYKPENQPTHITIMSRINN